jgi:hypothetical protein
MTDAYNPGREAGYTPDKFVVVKVHNPKDPHYRVFGTWYGGYLGADSWRLNSGVAKVVKRGPLLDFYGSSGSVYTVHKDTYGTSVWTQSQLALMADVNKTKLEVLPEETDWVNFNWSLNEN